MPINEEKLGLLRNLKPFTDNTAIGEDIDALIAHYCSDSAAEELPVQETAQFVEYRGCKIRRGHRWGTYIIPEGARIALTLSPSTPKAAQNYRKKLVNEGAVKDKYSEGYAVALKEIEGSASMVVTLIAGSNRSGTPILAPILWTGGASSERGEG